MVYNRLKTIAKKFHLYLSPFVDKAINIEDFTLKTNYTEVLLGVTRLTVYCILHVLSHVSKYISFVYLWSQSLSLSSGTALSSGWHIVGGSTIRLIIFTKPLSALFTKTSKQTSFACETLRNRVHYKSLSKI